MGCDFLIHNITRDSKYNPELAKKIFDTKTYLLTRNIDRGSTSHFYKVIFTIIKIMNWDLNDEITISCCCNSYTYSNHELKCDYDPEWKANDNNGCYINHCPICTKSDELLMCNMNM